MAEKQTEMFDRKDGPPQEGEVTPQILREVIEAMDESIGSVPNSELQQISFALYERARLEKRSARKVLNNIIEAAAPRPRAQIGPDGKVIPPPNPIKEKPKTAFDPQTVKDAREIAQSFGLTLADSVIERLLYETELLQTKGDRSMPFFDVFRQKVLDVLKKSKMADGIDYSGMREQLMQPPQPDGPPF